MIANHIQQARAQVQALRSALERHRFRGFCAPPRLISAALTVGIGALLLKGTIPVTAEAHLWAWGTLCLLAGAMNAGSLLYWFWHDEEANRVWRRLGPVVDVLPPLLIGGVLSSALVFGGHFDYLFGVWMCLFGMANFNARHMLAPGIARVGIFYMVSGAACLIMPMPFTNPLPMMMVFAIGELAGGLVLHFDQTRNLEEI